MLVIKDSDIQSKKHKTQFDIRQQFFLTKLDTADTLSDSEKKKLLGSQISSILTLYNISVESHSESNDNDLYNETDK